MTDLTHLTIDGAKLAEARQRASLTQDEAAEAVGLGDRRAISKIEKTGRTSSDVIARLCALYKVELKQVTTTA